VELVVRFIADENYGNPVSQLQAVLTVITSTPSSEIRSDSSALFDNLYTHIFAGIPSDVLPTTKLLLTWSFCCPWHLPNDLTPAIELPLVCNLLNIDQATTYDALEKLHSVVRIPLPEDVNHRSWLQVFHASFTDYLKSSLCSGQYCIMLTLEEAIPYFLQKLLESHNPG
jgi:hypothetical protein